MTAQPAPRSLGNVLVVSEEEGRRGDIDQALSSAGHRVRSAANSETAFQIAQVEAFDFAIVDMELGYGTSNDGLAAAKLLARCLPNVKMVMLSASARESVDADLDEIVPRPAGYVWMMDPEKSYLEEACAEVKRLAAIQPKKRCFVIMPRSTTPSCDEEEWSDIFDKLIREGVERVSRYECVRSSPLYGNVIEQIFDSLNSAELVIADLTDRNPNVFYELGVRHSLQDATILIAQSIDHVPFDLRHVATIVYDWRSQAGRERLKTELASAVQGVATDIENGNRDRIASPVRRYIRPPSQDRRYGS